MRKAELSSITTAPADTAIGANSLLMAVLTDINAKSTPSKESDVVSSTVNVLPLTSIFLPDERWDANSFKLPISGCRFAMIAKNSDPTTPVAPTTAILKLSQFGSMLRLIVVNT